MQYFKFVVLLVFFWPDLVPADDQHVLVKRWAVKLGDELWDLNSALTSPEDIKQKYNKMNARVKKKDGKQILESSLGSVRTMLNRKINAVKCIHAYAEKLAEEFNYTNFNDSEFRTNMDFQYCDAKYSEFSSLEENEEQPPKPVFINQDDENSKEHFLNVSLERDSHFYDIRVDTNISCVHVPTNIYFREENALTSILWSERLTEVFIRNYKSDPSLSWQYFGSSHGIMRFYPGMKWNTQGADTYDCRVKSWYIEAATCSKDAVILFDVSGSMTGFKNYVARRTLMSILSTLSNNDYVNVLYFNNNTDLVVSCFEGLVQATPENIKTLIDALEPKENKNGEKEHKIKLEGNANLEKAYIKAFNILSQRRNETKCPVNSDQGCNQQVMLITDYVPGNFTEIFEMYNRETVHNKTYIPVRVFTYLIGKEVTNIEEIQWMACSNRGYFVHIHSVEEVQQQVLKYINVIARPMILNGTQPPPTWTHANIDNTRTKEWNVSADVRKPDEDKLVASVAIPAFDYRYNRERGDAVLLGVAGTDVPLESIAKLAQPHQLGVNGYSFIVSNNGYLLLHPYLIATINDKLQQNYNSVDFVEVEQVDDGLNSRQLGAEIQDLRHLLVMGSDGSRTGIPVLFHYDKMRRIARVSHNYYFKELDQTPFSMGISLPDVYGDTELQLKSNPLEAVVGKGATGINVTDYFRFNYRVHPDWVYCKYHYLEGHETENPEMEIWTFLVAISKEEINVTRKQYSVTPEMEDDFEFETDCGNAGELDKDAYYCNEDLVQQLVFDAKLTTPYFKTWKASAAQKRLADDYKVSVRFIATAGGLTRWHYINDQDKNERVNDTGWRYKEYDGQVFGDEYFNAIEETWYKAAVLQRMATNGTDSLVIATRLPILDKMIRDRESVQNEDGDITVTASYAIFYKDLDISTPASVVGFQFSYKHFLRRFKKLICHDQADPGLYNYYLIDSSGYVVLYTDCGKEESKEELSRIGQFFGVIDQNAYVMQCFLDAHVFENVTVFNYQAVCPVSILVTESAWSLQTPFSIVGNFIRWLLTEVVFLIINWNENGYTYASAVDPDYEYTTTAVPDIEIESENESPSEPKAENDEETFSCDHSILLYILQQTYFFTESGVPRTVDKNHKNCTARCTPKFWASYVAKTNLLFVMVEKDTENYEGCKKANSTEPEVTDSSKNSSEPCHKLALGQLPRRRLAGCYTYNDKEKDITACGDANSLSVDVLLFLAASLTSIAILFS